MRLEARKYLYDIQRAAALLNEFTEGKRASSCHAASRGGTPI